MYIKASATWEYPSDILVCQSSDSGAFYFQVLSRSKGMLNMLLGVPVIVVLAFL